MRQIKFRAWDGERMYRVDSAMWNAERRMHGLFIHEGELCHHIDHAEPATIMQFTGLLDKNGKEIYEGDVVTWTAEHEMGLLVHQREVVFVNGFFGIDSVIGIHPVVEYQKIVKLEVIGNIYENPELLKV